jgi:hypothetical protein
MKNNHFGVFLVTISSRGDAPDYIKFVVGALAPKLVVDALAPCVCSRRKSDLSDYKPTTNTTNSTKGVVAKYPHKQLFLWVFSHSSLGLPSSLYTSLLDTGCIPKSTTDTRNKRIFLMAPNVRAYLVKSIKINNLKAYV